MTFEKGHAGRPKGAHPKAAFDLQAVLNNRFPAQILSRDKKLEALLAAKQSKGRNLLRQYLSGGKSLTTRQAIIAQCCECLGYYEEGLVDCECPLCSLYPFMPYRAKK